jgi:hypothetical protein
MEELDRMQNSVMMLVIGITSSYFSRLLGCKTQMLMMSNIYITHLMEFLSLYITVSMSSIEPESPLQTLISVIKYYCFFMMFTKMNLYFTVLSFVLMFIVTVIKNYIKYLAYKLSDEKENNKPDINFIAKLDKFKEILIMTILATIVTGFIMYFIKQKKDHSDNWSLLRFIFGYTGCVP